MYFFARPKATRPIAVILYGLFLGAFTLALHPRIVEPFGDHLPVKDTELAALSDLIPVAVLNRGFKSSHTEGRATFFVTKIYQLTELQGVFVLVSRQIQVPDQYPVVSSRLIRAPPPLAIF
jgi:hypothetical protein